LRTGFTKLQLLPDGATGDGDGFSAGGGGKKNSQKEGWHQAFTERHGQFLLGWLTPVGCSLIVDLLSAEAK
jgi:hypothetical protein